MTIFDIEIISDVVCPWCYIGYRRLQKAIELFRKTYPGGSKDTFNIIWKPYFLDENPPAAPVSRQERVLSRMPPERAASVLQHIQRVGSGEGIHFAQGSKIGGTELSHALLHLAGKIGAEQQTKVAEELFRAHFEEEKDIYSVPVLVEIGVAAGMERDAVEKGLTQSEVADEVRKEEKEIKSTGIRGVPRFSVGGVSIVGASDVGDFFERLLQIKEGRTE